MIAEVSVEQLLIVLPLFFQSTLLCSHSSNGLEAIQSDAYSWCVQTLELHDSFPSSSSHADVRAAGLRGVLYHKYRNYLMVDGMGQGYGSLLESAFPQTVKAGTAPHELFS